MTSRRRSVAVDIISAVAFTRPDLGTRESILFTPTELMTSRDETGGLSSHLADKSVCAIVGNGRYGRYTLLHSLLSPRLYLTVYIWSQMNWYLSGSALG